MNIDQIEAKVKSIDKSKSDFIYELLQAYGLPKASISRLRSGNLNLSKSDNIIIWKKKLFYQVELNADLHLTIDELVGSTNTQKHNPRFIIVTDYDTILSIDTKTGDSLDVELERLDRHYDFFLPWASMEKSQLQNENPADIKAAEKMAKLFDEIKKDNLDDSVKFKHELNVFMARLLFCFFAEDTNIFDKDIFTNGINSFTQEDGSDLDEFLNKLFLLLNQPNSERTNTPSYLKNYPYVGGRLFRHNYKSPKFSKRSRQAIIDSGVLDWSEINPDIFGSMMQSVVSQEQRESTGMHYTSVANIMKLIEPLFLNELYEQFEEAKGNEQKLNKLLHRLSNLKIFDPACGSGNFLIIAYKELRRLEIEIIKELGQISIYSSITLENFYGIEIDDFSHEIAILSLWLTKHQMSVEFHKEFKISKPSLPLSETGNIMKGNACVVNWTDLCPKSNSHEIIIIGNPPYCGSSMQSLEQKKDMEIVLKEYPNYKNLDYVTCWFKIASDFIVGSKSKFAFVSTNSICQGEQIGLLWPKILTKNLEIFFAHQSFNWSNSAKNNAKVIVIIVGVKTASDGEKFIFNQSKKLKCDYINPYLTPGKAPVLLRRSLVLSELPKMVWGNKATDGGYLNLSKQEKDLLIKTNFNAGKFIKKYVGSQEFIKGIEKWCIWVKDEELDEASKIEDISIRFQNVKQFRNASKARSTRLASNYSHRFIQIQHEPGNALIVPSVSSSSREYIPIGFVDKNTVVNAQCYAIYDSPTYLFSILSSKMHMVWVNAVAGRLKNDIRYSSALCYNSFPFPQISKNRKQDLLQITFQILEEREIYSDKTMGQLYDPNKMPQKLKETHKQNDLAIEKCYRQTPFSNDDERLEYLFSLYERMIELEQSENTLFANEVKKKRKRRINA